MTLNQCAPRLLSTRLTSRGEPMRPRVRELYDGYLEHHILPALGDVGMARLTPATIRRGAPNC